MIKSLKIPGQRYLKQFQIFRVIGKLIFQIRGHHKGIALVQCFLRVSFYLEIEATVGQKAEKYIGVVAAKLWSGMRCEKPRHLHGSNALRGLVDPRVPVLQSVYPPWRPAAF